MFQRGACFIIAEAGVNHNGSLDRALELVAAAAAAGADAVKFQTFKAERVVAESAAKAPYQKRATGGEGTQLAMIRALELSEAQHQRLLAACAERGVQFLSTPFDAESADFLARGLNVPVLKIGSGEITNAPLLLHIARFGKPVILSTGMATLGEVEAALGVLAYGYGAQATAAPSVEAFHAAFCSPEGQEALRRNVQLLHCTTEYPAAFETINLRAMDTLAAAFGLSVGLSDHSEGIAVPIAAVARGARIVEKHFTLDRNLPGPDHRASLEPTELAAMVRAIRAVEAALGDPRKMPMPCELPNREVARRSLVAARPIERGEAFSADNLAVKRPGTGVAPVHYWSYLGRTAARAYRADELIDP